MNDAGTDKLLLKSKYQTYERRKSSCNSALCSVSLFQSGSGWVHPIPDRSKGEDMTIAEVIKTRRAELGLSKYELSDMTGIARSTILRYETGEHKPETLTILLDALGLELCVREKE